MLISLWSQTASKMRLQGFLVFISFHCALSFKETSDEITALLDTLNDKSTEDAIESGSRPVKTDTGTFHDPRQVKNNFGIVEPFPKNIFAIEFTSASVTCVAYDSSGIKVPDKIMFMRRNEFNEYRVLTANSNLYFTNRTEGNGRKLFVTLHFRKLTMQDDSRFGKYECHAFAVDDPVARRHGFAVVVLRAPSSATGKPQTPSSAHPTASKIPKISSSVFHAPLTSTIRPTPSVPPTSTPTITPTTPTDNECNCYQFLQEPDRSHSFDYRKVPGGRPKCDSLLQTKWYRFVGLAGDRMPEECVPSYRCGTNATGWLRGGHPTVHEGVVSRTVCYHWVSNCCWRSNSILVRNCGRFFVYRLQRPPGCHYRYCGVGYTPPNPTPPPECSSYKIPDEFDRATGYKGVVKCDRSLLKGWYRIQGPAGEKMPNTCVAKGRCGTHAPGWLSGAHPTVAQGAVRRKVCFHWSSSCCQWFANIRVRNCGAFYVYELSPPPACSLRYCGNREQAPTPTPTQVPSPTSTQGYECLRYRLLDEADRSQAYDYRKVSGARPTCDNALKTDWYRFIGLAGDQMPEECVPSYRCGTHATGWLRGGHPTVHNGVVSRTVCYHWANNCCWRSNNILVRNCGRFFVYKLQRPPGCHYRYCGVGSQKPTPSPVSSECSHYKVLDETNRSQGYEGVVVRCDRPLAKGWYRFQGRAGEQMPQICVPKQRCGTHAPGWLDGGHPTVAEGTVQRKVCFHWSSRCCQWSTNIRVRNCGAFYVYELSSTPACNLRYCGDGKQAPTPNPRYPECSHYAVLDENDRAQSYNGVSVVKCDRSLSKRWYRLQGLAGKQMPYTCVPKQKCGTHAPGWLSGGHPTVAQGAVQRKVCFHWSSSCCRWSVNIRIRNCGAYYVYELPPTPFCSLRYCGDGK